LSPASVEAPFSALGIASMAVLISSKFSIVETVHGKQNMEIFGN
jgi:hypothetical protein